MKESKVSEMQLSMRWLPVVDARGRVRMEAVWVTAGAIAQLKPHAA
jgi:hypothetical protein